MKQHLQSRMAQRGEGGFTLIELLVVIAILGILSAVVVFAVGNTTDKAQDRACKIEKRTLKTAIEAFRIEVGNGNYPATGDVAGFTELQDNDLLDDDTTPAQLAGRFDYASVAKVAAGAPTPDGPDGIPGNADDNTGTPAVPASYTLSYDANGVCV